MTTDTALAAPTSGLIDTLAAAHDLAEALDAWRAQLGEASVLTADEALCRYGADTSRIERHIAAALQPASVEDVQAVVSIAARHRVPLYPVSGGRNWGYGSANPPVDGCVIVDLSRLDQIAVDEELGLVTVEPGVTQQSLAAYLDQHALPFMAPVGGGGPRCSIIGNALERGYGPTPHTDHFGAVIGLEAVLPTGELYRSPLAELGADEGENVYKWGVGPYLDGLFAQGSFGIVTRMTIALARRPERSGLFFFMVRDDAGLEEAVVAVRELLRAAGANVGSINLMSDVRLLAMSVPYPRSRIGKPGSLSDDTIAALAKRMRIGAWAGVGSVYGSREHLRATWRLVRRVLGPHVHDLEFVDTRHLDLAREGLKRLTRAASRGRGRLGKLGAHLQSKLESMAARFDLTQGRPSEASLPLAYWRSGKDVPSHGLDPARDGCGLLWYAPVVPMRPNRVRCYVDTMRRVGRAHGFDIPITLTSLSERAFDSTVALLFSRESDDESARADACYRALFAAGRTRGFIPRRVGVQFMPLLVEPAHTCWQMGSQLQRAIDPAGIMAPGRYVLPRRTSTAQ